MDWLNALQLVQTVVYGVLTVVLVVDIVRRRRRDRATARLYARVDAEGWTDENYAELKRLYPRR